MVSVKGRESVNDVDFPQRIFRQVLNYVKFNYVTIRNLKDCLSPATFSEGWLHFLGRNSHYGDSLNFPNGWRMFFSSSSSSNGKSQFQQKFNLMRFLAMPGKHDLSVVPVFRTYTGLQWSLRFVTSCV